MDIHSVMPTYYYGNGHVSTGRIFNLFTEHKEIWASLHRLNGYKWCHLICSGTWDAWPFIPLK